MTAEEEVEFLRVVGRRVRVHRLVRELTQEQLADAAGISRSFLSLLEHGARGVDVVRLLRLAAVLGVPLHELIRDAETAGTPNIQPSAEVAAARGVVETLRAVSAPGTTTEAVVSAVVALEAAHAYQLSLVQLRTGAERLGPPGPVDELLDGAAAEVGGRRYALRAALEAALGGGAVADRLNTAVEAARSRARMDLDTARGAQ